MNSAIGLPVFEQGRRPENARERHKRRIILPHCLDIIATRDGDAVFRALKLRLQRKKILVRLQVRIILADRQKMAERAAKLRLRILEGLEFCRVGKIRGINMHLRRLGACLGHLNQHILLLLGVTLNGCDKVWNEVGAALIIVLHLRPFGLGIFLQGRNLIVAAGRNWKREQNDEEKSAQTRNRRHHKGLVIKIERLTLRRGLSQGSHRRVNWVTAATPAIACDHGAPSHAVRQKTSKSKLGIFRMIAAV